MRGAEGPEHQIKKILKKLYFKLLSIFIECGKCASSRSEGRAEGLCWNMHCARSSELESIYFDLVALFVYELKILSKSKYIEFHAN